MARPRKRVQPRGRLSAGIALLISISVVALAGPPTALGGQPAAQLFVDDDGKYGPGCDGTGQVAFRRIQAAVNAVNLDNSKINVCPGTYTGRIRVNDENGLIIRAVEPWTATLKPPLGEPYNWGNVNLVSVKGVSGTKIVWLNVVIPTDDDEGCRRSVNSVFLVDNAPQTTIRANHVRVTDPSTFPCGYGHGVSLFNSPQSTIAWNRFVDFHDGGIYAEESNNLAIRGNTLLYGHDGFILNFDYSCALCTWEVHDTVVRVNIIESGPTAGTTAPTLEFGIHAVGDRLFVRGNRVLRTLGGVELHGSGGEIVRNTIRRSGNVGLLLGGDVGNVVTDNVVRNSGVLDCGDYSTGSGTAGTGNLWVGNIGATDDPDGICTSQ